MLRTLLGIITIIQCFFAQGVYVFDSIVVNSQYRKFRLYVPASYTGQSVPLVLNFHGYGMDALQQLQYTQMMPVADTAAFIIAYPEGTPDMYNKKFFNAGIVSGPPDDVAFTSQLISHLSSQYAINPNRIYSCGMSNGGFMSYYLSCTLPHTFAAVGSVTGSNFVNWYPCQPGRIFPAIQIHGTNDATVPYAGNSTMAPIDSVVNKYRIICGLLNTPQTYSFANTSFTDNCTAVSYRYLNNSNQKIMVELIKVNGGAHTWPGASYNIPGTCYDLNASVELWRFFSQHVLSDYVTDIEHDLYDNKMLRKIEVFPNPAFDKIRVEDATVRKAELIFADGKSMICPIQNQIIHLEHLPEGVYLLRLLGDRPTVHRIMIHR